MMSLIFFSVRLVCLWSDSYANKWFMVSINWSKRDRKWNYLVSICTFLLVLAEFFLLEFSKSYPCFLCFVGILPFFCWFREFFGGWDARFVLVQTSLSVTNVSEQKNVCAHNLIGFNAILICWIKSDSYRTVVELNIKKTEKMNDNSKGIFMGTLHEYICSLCTLFRPTMLSDVNLTN